MRVIGFISLSLVISLTFHACQSEKQEVKEPASALAPPYTLDTTLLGPTTEIEPCLKTFRPPMHFDSIPANQLANLKARFREKVERRLVELQLVLANNSWGGGGTMAFSVDGLYIHSDTSKFFNGYRDGLIQRYGAANVSELSFWLEDSIYVKDYRLIDSLSLHHNVISISRHGSAMEVQYILPHAAAGTLLPSVKSSIMSVMRAPDYPVTDSLHNATE